MSTKYDPSNKILNFIVLDDIYYNIFKYGNQRVRPHLTSPRTEKITIGNIISFNSGVKL